MMADREHISLQETGPSSPQQQDTKGVWVFAEHDEGKLEDHSLLLACEGRGVADKVAGDVSVVLLGSEVRSLVGAFGAYGVDRAFVVEDRYLEGYTAYTYVDVLTQLVEQYRPSAILFAASPLGNDLAPRLAARLKVALVAHYTQIDVDSEGRLLVHRPIHGGKAQATVTPLKKPMVATVNSQLLTLKKARQAREPEVIEARVWVDPKSSRTKVINYLRADPCAVCVSEAEIVIGIGKGLQHVENLAAVEELARVLGASIGGSRRATDERWIADERRIGLTGKTICPRLYLVCGVSGAFHHTLSIKGSQLMVSINTDRSAPIGKLADLAVLGDMQEIIPELTRQLREIMRPRA